MADDNQRSLLANLLSGGYQPQSMLSPLSSLLMSQSLLPPPSGDTATTRAMLPDSPNTLAELLMPNRGSGPTSWLQPPQSIGEGVGLAMAAIPGARRPYGGTSDALMGYRKTGPNTPYDAQNFSHHQPVKVDLGGGNIFEDSVRGLNRTHAMERARRNWPDAKAIDALEVGQVTEPSLVQFFKSLIP